MSIYYNYTMSVSGDTAKLDKDIYLYKGNRNIDYYFTIKEAGFKFSRTEGQNIIEKLTPSHVAVTLLKPDGSEVGTGKAEVLNDKIKLTITEDMIDETTEVGDHTIVIDLLDDEKNSIATLPPILKQFHVKERITNLNVNEITASNVVNEAVVGYAETTLQNEALQVFDSEGNYIKTVWIEKDKITVEKLNKIEEAMYKNTAQIKGIAKDLIIENGLLYLKKEDGTKIGLGVTLPSTSGGSEKSWEELWIENIVLSEGVTSLTKDTLKDLTKYDEVFVYAEISKSDLEDSTTFNGINFGGMSFCYFSFANVSLTAGQNACHVCYPKAPIPYSTGFKHSAGLAYNTPNIYGTFSHAGTITNSVINFGINKAYKGTVNLKIYGR